MPRNVNLSLGTMRVKKDFNREITLQYLAGIIAVLCLSVIGVILFNQIAPTDLEQLNLLRREFVPASRGLLNPEPQERITFIILVIISPVICFLASLVVNKIHILKENVLTRQLHYWEWFTLGIVISAAMVFLLSSKDLLWWLFCPAYNGWFWLLAILFAGIVAFYMTRTKKLSPPINTAVIYALILVPLLQVLCCRIYTLDRISLNNPEPHPNIIGYAISQAVAGWTDYHQYGFYPRILAPIFHIISPNLLNISIVMGIIFCAGLYALSWTMFQIVKNKLLVLMFALISFLTMGAWNFLNHSDGLYIDPYFAYYPVRFVCPAMAVMAFWLASRYGKNIAYVICGALAGFGLWWNIDSAIPIAVATFGVCGLELFFSFERRRVFKTLILLTVGLLLGFITVYLFLGLFSPGNVSITGNNKFIRLFYQAGFVMLPMPAPPAAWCFFAGVYIFTIVTTLNSFRVRQITPACRMSLFLAVLGIGLFAYYQGRSHIFNLPAVIWPALILLFINADRLFRMIKTGRLRRYYIVLTLPVLFLTMLASTTLCLDTGKIVTGVKRTILSLPSCDEKNPIEQNIRFILRNAGDYRQVNIISHMQGVYYAETGLKAGIANFGLEEQLRFDDHVRVMECLSVSRFPLFISTFPASGGNLPSWVRRYYELRAVNNNQHTMMLFMPKGEVIQRRK